MLGRLCGALYVRFSQWISVRASISPASAAGRRFLRFGARSLIMWKPTTIFNERYIAIGEDTLIGPGVALSAGMVPGQECLTSPVVTIGDRCLIGKGSGIVGHFSIVIGDDVWTGHHVYITDQNHGYTDVSKPISQQSQPERPVSIGNGSWLGHGSIVLPGVTIGEHVVVGANSVVTRDIPSYSVAVGSPARVIRRYDAENGWVDVD
jgi:acetyltransferase-like isoleucine patch superfamily enzyme